MDQNEENCDLMILNKLMELLGWVRMWEILFGSKVSSEESFGRKLSFWAKSRFKHFWGISCFE